MIFVAVVVIWGQITMFFRPSLHKTAKLCSDGAKISAIYLVFQTIATQNGLFM